jgi:hypothetical protein
MKEISKTYVYLTDARGWEKRIEHVGDYRCGEVYMERRVADMSKPFGELLPDDKKYYMYGENVSVVDEEYVKKMFFMER